MLKDHIFYKVSPHDHKSRLMETGLSIADLARELSEQYPDVAYRSLYTYIHNMICCRDYYPRYAMILNSKYGFKFERPAHMRSTRQLLKAA